MSMHLVDPAMAMRELEQVEHAIRLSSAWMDALSARRTVLEDHLELATRPAVAPAQSVNTVLLRGFRYRGELHAARNFIDVHVGVLRKLWLDFPEKRPAMAAAMSIFGATRRYVATDRRALFIGQSEAFSVKYSRMLVDGWYVDTNLSWERMKCILPAAVRASGLHWNEDVQAYWTLTRVASGS